MLTHTAYGVAFTGSERIQKGYSHLIGEFEISVDGESLAHGITLLSYFKMCGKPTAIRRLSTALSRS